jgi:hypothetical protein
LALSAVNLRASLSSPQPARSCLRACARDCMSTGWGEEGLVDVNGTWLPIF